MEASPHRSGRTNEYSPVLCRCGRNICIDSEYFVQRLVPGYLGRPGGTMILLLDLCYREGSLSRPEFVTPIRRIVEKSGGDADIVHYSDLDFLPSGISGVILCGTALKDNSYLEHLDWFRWLEHSRVPVLGICAGMQVLACLLGGEVVRAPEIGMTEVKVTQKDLVLGHERTFPAYELHNFGVTLPPGCTGLAGSGCCIQAFRSRERPWWGVMFHPEVRNEWVVERFVGVSSPGPAD